LLSNGLRNRARLLLRDQKHRFVVQLCVLIGWVEHNELAVCRNALLFTGSRPQCLDQFRECQRLAGTLLVSFAIRLGFVGALERLISAADVDVDVPPTSK
jgi:hypothetical protein